MLHHCSCTAHAAPSPLSSGVLLPVFAARAACCAFHLRTRDVKLEMLSLAVWNVS